MQAPLVFSVRPIPGAPFGVEIEANLRKPMDEANWQALNEVYRKEKLLMFRRQNLTFDEHQGVVGHFGTVLEDHYREISAEGNLGSIALCFHSDLSFTTDPHDGLSLHALDVNDGQTSTRFASGIRAWERLPPELKDKIEDKKVLALMALVQSRRSLPADPPDFLQRALHDVVRKHPVTGENILYVTQMHSLFIEGFVRSESDALLAELFDRLYAPDNVYEHRWVKGDLVIWDNLALQHARPNLEGCVPRRLQRVTLATKGFLELCPEVDWGSEEIKRWVAAVD